jgi:trans-2,3-dihydro-3-hydroxyanthranilate isomerase
VFTDVACAGNALAVVHGADDLDDATMAAFARETRLSETSFVQTADQAAADYRHRIWTIARELPFAGHPSLGTAVAVARERGDTEARYVQQTRAGLQPVQVTVEGDRARAAMHQEPAVFGDELDPTGVLAAVGLGAGDADPALPPQLVSTGVRQLLVLAARPDALARTRPDDARIGALLAEHDAVVLYLAWVDRRTGEARARSFSPVVEGGEDPGTGSAAGPLCAYLAQRGGPAALRILQGAEMGRPSRLLAEMDGERPRVAGDVVVLVDGSLRL